MKRITFSLALLGITSSMELVAQAPKVDTLKVRELEEVSVISTRAGVRTPMAYGNITKTKISKSNVGPDIPYLLQTQPSVVFSSDGGTGVGYTSFRVRGVDASGINVMINGVPLNDSESLSVFWVNMPDFASNLQELQLQRGVGTSTSGAAAFGASLNMRTDAISTTPYAVANLGVGSYGLNRQTIKVGTGTIAEHFSIDARLSRVKSKGYVDRSGVDQTGYSLQAGYYNHKTMIRFLTFGGHQRTGIAWDGLDAETEATHGRRYNPAGIRPSGDPYYNSDNYSQPHYQLMMSHKFNPSLSFNLTLHHTAGFGYTDKYKSKISLKKYNLSTFTDSSGEKVKKVDIIRRKYLDNTFQGFVSSLNWTGKKLQLNGGLSMNQYEGDHFGEIRWISSYPTPVYPEDRYYDNWARKRDFSGYLKANYSFTNQLSAFADVQLRHINYRILGVTDKYDEATEAMHKVDISKKFTFFNPKLGVFYQINPSQHVFASMAVAHREPARKNYTEALDKNQDPRAEKLIDYELGYGYTTDALKLSAGLYYMDYKDQLVPNGKLSDVGEALMENVVSSYRFGLEASADYQPLKWLRLMATLGLSKNRIKSYDYYINGVAHTYKDSPLGYSPTWVTGQAVTFIPLKGLEIGLANQFVSRQYLDNTGSRDRSLPSYNVLNLRASYDLPIRGLRECRLSFQVNNLLNREYTSNGWAYFYMDSGKEVSVIGYYPQAPTNFFATLSIGI